ncbi:alpha-amylase C-terminal beta-sheet domain-containing protein [Thalassomonas actiniarum]|uniref:Alpha-amylase n=1 Tax=Thalassomonas actiniarum TaxID=485447 RepID=A0AAE9YTX3_9GAMM|nr:alpha-amylase C-terminal beta-sheet domain-containing protein [Thalassomonas actiniarum]WDE01026.1 alpha-amylase [Thalassomonas actiniarum]
MIRKMILAIAVGIAASSAVTQAATEQDKASSAILLQGFHWHSHKTNWYDTIKNQADSVAGLGVSHVWFPPVSDAASDEGYLPRQLNVLDSNYGSEQALTQAIFALKNKGVSAVADVVINHRVGTLDWADFTNPAWGSWAVTCDDEWPGATGDCDTGGGYAAARDVNHVNNTVQADIVTWLNTRLKAVGFEGIRYDYSKGYDPYYAGMYSREVGSNFCVGEVWTDLHYDNVDAHRQLLMDYINGTSGECGVFDFTTKGLLNKALENNEYWRLANNGSPAGGIGWWGQKMVTFVDNHDTGPSESCGSGQQHWPVPCDKVMQGYAYILTHPGIPTIYWAHAFDWNLYDDIKVLADIRKQQGLSSTSSVSIQAAQTGLYAAIIDDKVAVKIGGSNWSPGGSGWQLAASGSDYAVWTLGEGNDEKERTVVFVFGETASGQDMFIRGGIDHDYAANNLGLSCTEANKLCALPISHNNLRNVTTASWKNNDNYLDWYGIENGQGAGAEGTAADWTTNAWSSSWGTKMTVAVNGFGEEPLNNYGDHYWMLDAQMDCSKTVNGWFELKTYISNGPGWEADVSQAGTPYASGNHFAQCGKISVFRRGESSAEFHDF